MEETLWIVISRVALGTIAALVALLVVEGIRTGKTNVNLLRILIVATTIAAISMGSIGNNVSSMILSVLFGVMLVRLFKSLP